MVVKVTNWFLQNSLFHVCITLTEWLQQSSRVIKHICYTNFDLLQLSFYPTKCKISLDWSISPYCKEIIDSVDYKFCNIKVSKFIDNKWINMQHILFFLVGNFTFTSFTLLSKLFLFWFYLNFFNIVFGVFRFCFLLFLFTIFPFLLCMIF